MFCSGALDNSVCFLLLHSLRLNCLRAAIFAAACTFRLELENGLRKLCRRGRRDCGFLCMLIALLHVGVIAALMCSHICTRSCGRSQPAKVGHFGLSHGFASRNACCMYTIWRAWASILGAIGRVWRELGRGKGRATNEFCATCTTRSCWCRSPKGDATFSFYAASASGVKGLTLHPLVDCLWAVWALVCAV